MYHGLHRLVGGCSRPTSYMSGRTNALESLKEAGKEKYVVLVGVSATFWLIESVTHAAGAPSLDWMGEDECAELICK